MCGNVYMSQTETPRREEWSVSSFSRILRAPVLRGVMGTSTVAWMPLPLPSGFLLDTAALTDRGVKEWQLIFEDACSDAARLPTHLRCVLGGGRPSPD